MSSGLLIAKTVDAMGLKCPEPVMMLHAAIRSVASAECVELLATDPSTQRDVGNFCRFLGHEMLVSEDTDARYRYVIKKGP